MTAVPADREAAIDAMLAREALRDLAMRYARAIDRRDPELLRSVYHDDAIDDHGAVFCDSATTFIANLHDIMAPFELTAHYICNMSYRVDGDTADGELYFIAYHRTPEPEPKHIMGRAAILTITPGATASGRSPTDGLYGTVSRH